MKQTGGFLTPYGFDMPEPKMKVTIELEEPVFDRFQAFAEKENVPLSLIIQNYLIDTWALETAKIELKLPNEQLPLKLAKQDDDAGLPITGESLFNFLKALYKEVLQGQRAWYKWRKKKGYLQP